jgi:cytochrome c biogenesis protein CcmG/thiol:disulfide interchange protein DsbE
MMRYLAPLVVFAIMIPVFMVGLQRDPTLLPSPFIDKPAPQFELPKLKDLSQTVSSKDYAGQVALVNVWATWCVGCRQEHEFLVRLAQENSLPIYGLNWRDHREDGLAWLNQLGDPYVASGYDADGRTGIDWGVYGAPETFLIGKDGRVLYKHLGPLDGVIWEREFVTRIAADSGAAE